MDTAFSTLTRKYLEDCYDRDGPNPPGSLQTDGKLVASFFVTIVIDREFFEYVRKNHPRVVFELSLNESFQKMMLAVEKYGPGRPRGNVL